MRTLPSVSVVLISSLVGACSSDPEAAAPVDLTVETFNVGLAGAFIPNEAERIRAVPAAVAAMPSDIVCLQEAWRQEDKDAIIAAARARFPHTYTARHDLSTVVNLDIDPMCGAGVTPPPEPTTAPCADPSLTTAFDAGITCLARSCSTMPGSEMGSTTSTMCATTSCISKVVGLLTAGAAGLRCYGCLAPQLPTETFASIRSACTTNPQAGLAFGGQSGTMILSRYPLSDTETMVMPGTWNRRVITRATATLPNGARVGVYCNHLTPVFEGAAFPYTGRYGCGRTDREGWSSEQTAQARALVSYVQRRDGAGRALILGDFNTSRASAAGQPEIVDEAPETYAIFTSAFQEALAPGYVPRCTFCPDNALTGNTAPTWLDHIFLHGLPASTVQSTERTFTTATVAVPGSAQPVHLSDHYGLRVRLRVSP